MLNIFMKTMKMMEVIRLTLINACECDGSGPMMHGWYKMLDAAIPTVTLKTTIMKLVLDQSIAAPTLIASFFVFVGVQHTFFIVVSFLVLTSRRA